MSLEDLLVVENYRLGVLRGRRELAKEIQEILETHNAPSDIYINMAKIRKLVAATIIIGDEV